MDKQILRDLVIAIIATITLCTFPFVQMILLTLNGGLTYIFALPFAATTESGVTETTSIIINFILATAGLTGLYFTKKIGLVILSVFIVMFSGQMLMLFMLDKIDPEGGLVTGWLILNGPPIISIAIVGL